MKTYHFPIVVEVDEEGFFIVSCPSFQGCRTYGKTISEAMDNIKEVIEMCLEEEGSKDMNQFIGLRELEISIPATA